MSDQGIDNQWYRSPLFTAILMFVPMVLITLIELMLDGTTKWVALLMLVVVEVGLAVLLGLRIAESRSERT